MKDDFSYLESIPGQFQAMKERLIQWSEINSGSLNLAGLDQMRSALIEEFSTLGGVLEEPELTPMEVVNDLGEVTSMPLAKALRIIKRPEAPIRVLFCGHMDTVFPVSHAFQKVHAVDDNTLNGPGLADMKGGLLVISRALQAFEASPFADKLGWEVLVNTDEEIGSHGSAWLLEEAAARNHFGLIYEPSTNDEGTFAGARKGSGNFTVVVRGKEAHAGREHHLGRNAICALAEFIHALDALNGQKPGVTVNVGVISGGRAVNVVPGLAIAKFNIRLHEQEDEAWVQQNMDKICQEMNAKEGFELKVHGGFKRKPKSLDSKHHYLFDCIKACGKDLGLPVAWKDTGGCCDGNDLAAAGLPNIDTMGVRGGKIHSDQEYIKLDSLIERTQLTALLLMRFARGDFQIKDLL